MNSPTNLRSKLGLFQVEPGLGGGWIAVPKGWRIISAGAGGQGSWGAIFVAPDGPSHRWLLIGGFGPGETEVFSAAEGYFPGAYQLENEIIPGALTRDAILRSKPDSLTHQKSCAALVS